MKTLKERVSELQKEIENRIINGEGSVIKLKANKSDGSQSSSFNRRVPQIFGKQKKKTFLSNTVP